jgi:hypothetical protein
MHAISCRKSNGWGGMQADGFQFCIIIGFSSNKTSKKVISKILEISKCLII